MADEINFNLEDSIEFNTAMLSLHATLKEIEMTLKNIQYGFEAFSKSISGVSGVFMNLADVAKDIEEKTLFVDTLQEDIKQMEDNIKNITKELNANVKANETLEETAARVLNMSEEELAKNAFLFNIVKETLRVHNQLLAAKKEVEESTKESVLFQEKLNKSLSESNAITKLNKKEVENFTKKVDETAKSAKKVENIFGDTTANIIKINYALKEVFNYVSGIFSFVFNALEKVDKRTQSGILFTALIGKDDPVKKLNEMKEATKFAISETDLIMKTVQARQFGIKTDINYLLETARDLSYITGRSITDTFDDMVLAIGRQSYMIADNMNIMVKKMEAAQNFAKKYGKELKSLTAEDRKLAFEEEFMRKANENISKFGKAQETVTEKLGKIKSIADDIAISFAKWIPDKFITFITGSLKILRAVAKELEPPEQKKYTAYSSQTSFEKASGFAKSFLDDKTLDIFSPTTKVFDFGKDNLGLEPMHYKMVEKSLRNFKDFFNNDVFPLIDSFSSNIQKKIDYVRKVIFHLNPSMQEITDFWQFQGTQFQAHYEAISFNEKLQNDVNEEVDALLSASSKQHLEDYVKFWEDQNKQFEKILKLNAEVMKFNMDLQNEVDEIVSNLPQQKSALDKYKENMRGYADALLDGANSVANASEQAMQKFLTFGESFNKNLANLFRSIAQSMQEAMIKPIAQSFGQQIGLSFLSNLSQSATQNQGGLIINNYSGMGAGVSYDNKGNKVVTVGVAQKNNNIKRGLR